MALVLPLPAAGAAPVPVHGTAMLPRESVPSVSLQPVRAPRDMLTASAAQKSRHQYPSHQYAMARLRAHTRSPIARGVVHPPFGTPACTSQPVAVPPPPPPRRLGHHCYSCCCLHPDPHSSTRR